MLQTKTIETHKPSNLKVSYKRELDLGAIVGKYINEVSHVIKNLMLMNEVVAEESNNSSLVKTVANESNDDLTSVKDLTKKLKMLFSNNGKYKQMKLIETIPKIVLGEVQDKTKARLDLKRIGLSQMYIKINHELLVSAFIAITEVLSDDKQKDVKLRYFQNEVFSQFEFKGGKSLLTDSLNGAYALEVLRAMDANVTWSLGSVSVSFKSYGKW